MPVQLKQGEVVLKDGRKVVMREGSALDEIVSCDLLGKVNPENPTETMMKQYTAQVALCILSVDGQKQERPKNHAELLKLMAEFKKGDWSKLTAKYNELNGDDAQDAQEGTPEDFLAK